LERLRGVGRTVRRQVERACQSGSAAPSWSQS
jgi:hypothetical protein